MNHEVNVVQQHPGGRRHAERPVRAVVFIDPKYVIDAQSKTETLQAEIRLCIDVGDERRLVHSLIGAVVAAEVILRLEIEGADRDICAIQLGQARRIVENC